MATQVEKAERFLELHHGETPLLLPNPWDVGSAKVLATLGFEALATTSGGFAATLGRLDGSVTRDEAIAHAATIAGATELPVSADLENAFADEPDGVAETIRLALDAGLAGCSVEDFTGTTDDPIYDLALATDRVRAAVEVAHRGDVHLVLTARAENHLHGIDDLDDTITRLQAFEAAGADVLYAPGLVEADQIARVVDSVDRPVNVLALPGGPTVVQLGEMGVARVSVGSAFSHVAFGALVQAARELQAGGPLGYWRLVRDGRSAERASFQS